MASWGRNVDLSIAGTGSIDANTAPNTVEGANTEFTTEVSIGNLVTLDETNFVVTGITDDDTLTVQPAADVDFTDEAITLSEVPKYLSVELATTEAVYITVEEAQDANTRSIGIKTPGWNLYKEYEDANGNTRRKVETLVAMKQTTA